MNLILGLVIPGMGKYHKHFYAPTSIKIIFQNKNICNTYYLEEFILQPNLIMIIFHTFQIYPRYIYIYIYNILSMIVSYAWAIRFVVHYLHIGIRAIEIHEIKNYVLVLNDK